MPVPPKLLDIEDLRVGYGRGTTALNHVSLSVPEASVVSLLGSNGAGKTTLLRAICGTLIFHGGAVHAGKISLAGERIDGWNPTRVVESGVRLVPEGRRIFGSMTVEENLLIGGLRGCSRRQRKDRIEEFYSIFPVLKRKHHQGAALLSGGEQQMLAIARSLMTEPRLLLLDEPSLGLAPTMIAQVTQIIQQVADRGTSILLVEQNASMALRLAKDVVVLRTGEVAYSGTANDLQASESLHSVYFGTAKTTTGVAE